MLRFGVLWAFRVYRPSFCPTNRMSRDGTTVTDDIFYRSRGTSGKYEYPLVGSYSHFCNLPVSDIGDQEASSVDTNAEKQ